MRGGQAGRARERLVMRHMEGKDWVVLKGTTYGIGDLVMGHIGKPTRLVEVKSTAAGPYATFGPRDRADMAAVAERAGWEAWLAWWPPRGKLVWIRSDEWPVGRERKAA